MTNKMCACCGKSLKRIIELVDVPLDKSVAAAVEEQEYMAGEKLKIIDGPGAIARKRDAAKSSYMGAVQERARAMNRLKNAGNSYECPVHGEIQRKKDKACVKHKMPQECDYNYYVRVWPEGRYDVRFGHFHSVDCAARFAEAIMGIDDRIVERNPYARERTINSAQEMWANMRPGDWKIISMNAGSTTRFLLSRNGNAVTVDGSGYWVAHNDAMVAKFYMEKSDASWDLKKAKVIERKLIKSKTKLL